MRHPKRWPRVATVCVLGRKAIHKTNNPPRIRLLRRVIADIVACRDWHPLDAVLLPGGYFWLSAFLGRLDTAQRIDAIEQHLFARVAIETAATLQDLSPGAVVVFGADSDDPTGDEKGDEFCVAVGKAGVVGLARKIFPTDFDTRYCHWPIVPDIRDYGAAERFIDLANGSKAVLCACYDAFGLTEWPNRPTSRTQTIRYLHGDGYTEYGDRGFIQLRRDCVSSWRESVDRQAPTVALAAIHDFKRPGFDGFWQRHGIASGSAALNGGLVVGAAHFHNKLPAIDQTPLASVAVSASHLGQGFYRQAKRLAPQDGFGISGKALRPALVRLFSVDGSPA